MLLWYYKEGWLWAHSWKMEIYWWMDICWSCWRTGGDEKQHLLRKRDEYCRNLCSSSSYNTFSQSQRFIVAATQTTDAVPHRNYRWRGWTICNYANCFFSHEFTGLKIEYDDKVNKVHFCYKRNKRTCVIKYCSFLKIENIINLSVYFRNAPRKVYVMYTTHT